MRSPTAKTYRQTYRLRIRFTVGAFELVTISCRSKLLTLIMHRAVQKISMPLYGEARSKFKSAVLQLRIKKTSVSLLLNVEKRS